MNEPDECGACGTSGFLCLESAPCRINGEPSRICRREHHCPMGCLTLEARAALPVIVWVLAAGVVAAVLGVITIAFLLGPRW